MHQTLIQRYEDSCLMLMDERADGFHFLGTCFFVHPKGYLLTAAHLLANAEKPTAVAPAAPGSFSPLARDDSLALPVDVVHLDTERDTALLRVHMDAEIAAPDDYIGNPEELGEGTYMLAFGISFGHFRIHNVMVSQAMLSAKMLTPNDTRILIFDSRVHPGDIGGPLVNAENGRILGVMQGSFNPLTIQQIEQPEDYVMESRFSYAVSIDYAHQLLREEGLIKSPLE